MATEELKYFFSYTHKDADFVLKLANELRTTGANVWLDQLDILGGQHWDCTVEKALKSCKGMMAVLSPDSVASPNVMDEVSYALDEGKQVVPILFRPCDIPLRLRRVQYVDFTADYDTGFAQLLRALHIEQPVGPSKSAASQEPVVQDSTAPPEEKPTEPVVHEKQAVPAVEEAPPQEVSEPIPSARDQSKPASLETETAPSKSRAAKVLAAICVVVLITIVSIGVFLKDDRPKADDAATNSIGMKLVYIPPGSFMMGLPSNEEIREGDEVITHEVLRTVKCFWSDEMPQHQVMITKGFWMGQTEVTQGQYESVMNAKPWSGKANVQEDANNPAVHVSWEDAVRFCEKLSQQEGKTYRAAHRSRVGICLPGGYNNSV